MLDARCKPEAGVLDERFEAHLSDSRRKLDTELAGWRGELHGLRGHLDGDLEKRLAEMIEPATAALDDKLEAHVVDSRRRLDAELAGWRSELEGCRGSLQSVLEKRLCEMLDAHCKPEAGALDDKLAAHLSRVEDSRKGLEARFAELEACRGDLKSGAAEVREADASGRKPEEERPGCDHAEQLAGVDQRLCDAL
eukprot:NODE_11466_length_1285_cov_1.698618.p2 GENE.NODE_11466_length_1285_cov_1.698618~~NODE_11466_length_1285_cov_1.698618.p2  ORF type:complete len:195 (+),score=72.63 NODE_11466_length_1285_cov_1.698618:481-1065(+)